MTRDDIIRMAREAGFDKTGRAPAYYALPEEIERFAALVAAAERSACAALVDANAMACHSPIYRSLLQSNAAAIRTREQSCPPCNHDCNEGRTCPARAHE